MVLLNFRYKKTPIKRGFLLSLTLNYLSLANSLAAKAAGTGT